MSSNPAFVLLRRVTSKAIQRCSYPVEASTYNKCRTIASTRNFNQYNQDQKANYDGKDSGKRFRVAKFTSLAVLTAGAYYRCRKIFPSQFSVLQAAELEGPKARGGTRRSTFNFVADVVEMSGSGVVFIERLGRMPFSSKRVPLSHGSGFLVEENGLIITNAHVVGNQSKLKVRLQDGREFEGQVLGVDEGMDLAAVRINCNKLPHLPLGASNDIRPGEWVVAMGSPLNLKNTVTAGIVSNIHRAGKELGLNDYDKRDMQYIQTDAMINVGNSGGPLINLDGEVIGVNSMMASAGIGFAIPADYVRDFLKRLNTALNDSGRRGSKPESRPKVGGRRYIGITMLTLTEDIADQLTLRDPKFPNVSRGVLVHRVQYNSPADKAGMIDGDVIVSMNGKEVLSTQDVYRILKTSNCIQVGVRRGEKLINLRVEPEDVM